MGRTTTKVTLFALLTLVVVFLSGCYKTSESTIEDSVADRTVIYSTINSYVSALESYNMNGMLDFLYKEDFLLFITEEEPYAVHRKDYEKLKSELGSKEANQLRWRQQPPRGYGYVLKMELADLVFSDEKATSVMVSTTFEIRERAAKLPEQVTDRGSMQMHMVLRGNEWLCKEIKISYEPFSNDSFLSLGIETVDAHKSGFGFGTFTFD